MIRPHKMRKELLLQEKGNITIKGAVATSKFDNKEKKSYDELKAERDRKDMN